MSTDDQLAGWCRILLEEALYRAANEASSDAVLATGRVHVSLPITVGAENDELVLELASAADGPVQLRLKWPFDELNGNLAATPDAQPTAS